MLPSKATLFGLDVRFRAVDKSIHDEKSKALSNKDFAGRKHAFKAKNRMLQMSSEKSTGGSLAETRNNNQDTSMFSMEKTFTSGFGVKAH